MSNFDYRIPDEMAAEVLAEATRLHAETSKGYSFADLEQACSEAQIPPHIVRQAIKNVEEKRLREQRKRQQLQEHIKQQVKRGMFAGILILIPAVAVSSIFIFRSQLEPVVSGLVSRFNLHLRTLTVKEGKLEYLTDPKGLSIAVRDTNASSYSEGVSNNGVVGIISTDGYESLPITFGKVGDSYEYKGIYDYRIKIIGVTYDSATFQIEQQGQQPQNAIKRLKDKVNELQEKSGKLQSQIKVLKGERDNIKQQLERERGNIKQQLEEKNKEIERLEKENDRLKFPALYN